MFQFLIFSFNADQDQIKEYSSITHSDKKWQAKTVKSNTEILVIIASATQDLFIEGRLIFQYSTKFLVIKETCLVLVC